ncbi:hypothetical protein D3C80_1633210 [compost metagenome]
MPVQAAEAAKAAAVKVEVKAAEAREAAVKAEDNRFLRVCCTTSRHSKFSERLKGLRPQHASCRRRGMSSFQENQSVRVR